MNLNNKFLIGIGVLILILGISALVLSNTMNPSEKNNSANSSENNMSPATDESASFIGTIWFANSINNSELTAGSSISVQFDNQGGLTGSDGCNTFSGSYEIDGSKINIDPNMMSTLKGCEEDVMNQADEFTKLLLASTSYKLGDGVMILLQGESEGLTFSGSTNALAKTSWNVTGYNNGKEAVVSPIIETNPTLVFGDDGTVSGSAGCNTYSGAYSINGESISIGTLATTRRMCIEPEGIMEQELSFLTYLEKAETWLIQGDILYLRTSEDQLAVTAVSNSVQN